MVDPKCWVWVGILIKKKFKSSSNATTKLSPLLFWVLFEIFDSQNFKGKSKLGNNEHVINPGEKVGEVAALRCSLDSTISWVSQNDSLDLLCHKFLKKKSCMRALLVMQCVSKYYKPYHWRLVLMARCRPPPPRRGYCWGTIEPHYPKYAHGITQKTYRLCGIVLLCSRETGQEKKLTARRSNFNSGLGNKVKKCSRSRE